MSETQTEAQTTDNTTLTEADRSEADSAAEDRQEAEPVDGNREAARYRVRLREAETERDHLAGVVEVYHRRDAASAAETAGMARGADLFDAGVKLVDLIGEDGAVDVELVRERVGEVLAERPHWRRRASGDIGQGPRVAAAAGPSWSNVLRPR